MLLDDAVHRGPGQGPVPLPTALVVKERLEDMGQTLRAEYRSRCHVPRGTHEPSRHRIWMQSRLLLVHGRFRRLNHEFAAGGTWRRGAFTAKFNNTCSIMPAIGNERRAGSPVPEP